MKTMPSSIRQALSMQSLLINCSTVLIASLLIAICAHITIPLWFTPVPITLQMFAIFVLAGILGSRRGPAAVLTYISEGLVGFPVFAGGKCGLAVLLSPTGGYLIGMVVTAFVIGKLVEYGVNKRFIYLFLSVIAASFITLFLGSLWLATFVGIKNAFALGVAPFLAGDLVKAFLASSILYTGSKWVQKSRTDSSKFNNNLI